MRKSAFFRIDASLSSILCELDDGRWKAASFDSLPSLLDYASKNAPALICWSGDEPEPIRTQILESIQENQDIRLSTNIILGRDPQAEIFYLKGGADEYLPLSCAEGLLKLRIENALKRKDAYREAREQMWISLGYRNAALAESLYIYDIDLKTCEATILRTSSEAVAGYYPLQCYTRGPESKPYFHPDDWHLIEETFSPESLAALLKSGRNEKKIEYRIRNTKNDWVWVESEIHLIRDMYGQMHGFSYVKVIDEAMREKEILEQIIREEIDLILSIDLETEWCKCIFSRSGKRPPAGRYTDTYYKKLIDSLDGAEAESIPRLLSLSVLRDELRDEKTRTYMYSMMLPDGQSVRKSLRVFYADERHQQLIMLRKDITEVYREAQKQKAQVEAALDEAEKANAAKSVFLSNVSHDMRTPLNGVIGYTDLALESSDIDLIHNYLTRISESGHILLRLVNDTLDLGKIENGLITLNPEPVGWTELIEDVIASVMPSAEAKKIQLTIDTSCCQRAEVRVDIARIQELLINLLSNAVKFTPRGGRVELIAMCSPLGGDKVRSTTIVRDNGIGIGADFIPRIFEPFAQEKNPLCADSSGSGLGLTIVKRIVGIMGGSIDVKSIPGSGSEFILHLDLDCDLNSRGLRQHESDASMRLKGKKVLLCEDHPMNTEIARGLLEKEGMTVVCAEDGAKGLAAFSASAPGEFALILMDIRMPVMNGLETARAIRALSRPDADKVPIIAMTANAFDEDVQKSRNAGMNAHLSKPIDPLVLYRTIQEAIP